MSDFKREIQIYGDHFFTFYNRQSAKVQGKIDWTITLIQTTPIVSSKFLKHLSNTDGLWEIRISAGDGIFRIFCFFDDGSLVVLLSGFQKKTQKTPKSEIKKAQKLKKEYYGNK